MRKCARCFATEEPGEHHKINNIIIKVRPPSLYTGGVELVLSVCVGVCVCVPAWKNIGRG